MSCVWDSLFWVSWSECVLRLGQFVFGLREGVCVVCGNIWMGFVGVSVCSVWEGLLWVLGSECLLCVRDFLLVLG